MSLSMKSGRGTRSDEEHLSLSVFVARLIYLGYNNSLSNA